MRIDWTKVGKEFTQGKQEQFLKAAQNLDWLELQKGKSLSLPMMQGEGIKGAIKELRLPKVSHIAYDSIPVMDCDGEDYYFFYGIHAHYKNADVKVFIIDDGCKLTPVFMEVNEIVMV
jgi:hypothetical protein